MGGMVRVDRDEAIRRIAEACSACHEVAAAYLFGSALGDMRPDSDIDVGVVLRPDEESAPKASFRHELQLQGDLEQQLGSQDGHRFQVTVFKASVGQSFFVVNVLQSAVLAYAADRAALSEFLERVAYLHRRDGPRHWAALAEVNGWDLRSIHRG